MCNLLNTFDLDVTEAVLRFILRPAQRVNNPRAIRSNFNPPHEHISFMVPAWGSCKNIVQCCRDDMEITDDMTDVKMKFYRFSDDQTKTPPVESSGTEEGVQLVKLDVSGDKRSCTDIYNEFVKTHTISRDDELTLANGIRIAKCITNPASRRQLVIIRLLALAIMGHTVSETGAQIRVFQYDPQLITSIVELLQPEKAIPVEVQTCALYALEALARYRGKLPEMLAAVNASANHGVLMQMLRKINTPEIEHVYPTEFSEALFAFVSHLLQTQIGGPMLMSAGIIPTLLHVVENQDPSIQIKSVTKVIGLLDTIVTSLATSFTVFCAANGLDVLLTRTKSEVDYCIKHADTQPMQGVVSTSTSTAGTPAEDTEAPVGALAPYHRLSAVKAMLKFLLRMMESSGTADGLRNLIDSSVPTTLLEIIENPKVFGNSVFALAINVHTTLIHNEPTSLPILQEANLPQAFLKTISKYENPNSEVLIAAVNAFGALCLNEKGLEMFNEANPLPHFFDLITRPDYVRNPLEIDHATSLGSHMDELIRHHPTLKPEVFKCVLRLMEKVEEIGKSPIGKPSDNSHQLQLITDSTDTKDKKSGNEPAEKSGQALTLAPKQEEEQKKEEKSECMLVMFIDLISRFLEGLFQNQTNIRGLIKENCIEHLLEYYFLPMLPADFSITIASDSLSYLFRMISEINPIQTALMIGSKVRKASEFIINEQEPATESLMRPYVEIRENDTAKINRGNELFHNLIVLHGTAALLSNTCCSSILSHGKNGGILLAEVLEVSGKDNLITLLGHLYRTMVWETVLFKESLPKSWYLSKPIKKPAGRLDNSLGIHGFDLMPEETNSAESVADATNKEDTLDPTDPRMLNVKRLKLLLIDISQSFLPVVHGLIKVSVTRRGMDVNQKANAFKLADIVAKLLRDNITWANGIKGEGSTLACKYDYLTSVYATTSLLLLDERSQSFIQTHLAIAFDRQGGTELLCKDLENIWQTAIVLYTIPDDSRTDAQNDLLARIECSIETLLTALLNISSSKLLHDSPYTPSITSKEKDRGAADYFDPHEWITAIQLKVSSVAHLLDSPQLHKFSKPVLRSLLKLVTQMMKGDGEVNTRATTPNPVSTTSFFSSPFGLLRPPTTANEQGIQTLIDMGFDRAVAEHALIRCNNQVSRAVDYMFSHPTQPFGVSAGANSNNTNNTPRPTVAEPSTAQDRATREGEAANAEHRGSQGAIDSHNLTDGSQHDSEHEGGDSENEDDEDEDEDDDDEEDEDEDEDDEEGDEDELDEFEDALTSLAFDTLHSSDQRSSSMEEDTVTDRITADRKAKQKEEALENSRRLKETREQLSENIPGKMLTFADMRGDLVFEIRDLLVVLCKNDTKQDIQIRILSLLVESIVSAKEELSKKEAKLAAAGPAAKKALSPVPSQKPKDTNANVKGSAEKKEAEEEEEEDLEAAILGRRLRLLALMLKEQPIQSVLPKIPSRLTFMLSMVDAASKTPVDEPLPKWLSAVLLVLEIFVSQADEPKSVELKKFKESSEDETMESPAKPKPTITITDEERSLLMGACIGLLKKTEIKRDDMYAILRVIVRLTKYNKSALSFVEMGGLPLLFTKPRTSLDGFQGQQAFIILILRHIIENKAVLEKTMEDMITVWFTIPRPRNMDINAFIRNNGHAALREPEVFLDVAKRICRLTRYDEFDTNRQVKLITKDQPEEGAALETKSDSPEASKEASSSAAVPSIPEAMKHTIKSGSSELVIYHLLNELLLVHAQEDPKPSADQKDGEQAESSANSPKILKYAYTGFILQCLVELVSSYASCKYDIYQFSRQRNTKDSNNVSRPRHFLLNMLINDFLPCGMSSGASDEANRQRGLSMWTASVLVAMCYDAPPNSETNAATKNELVQVRKYVLEGVIRSMKETVASNDSFSVKHSKYLGLADLCHRILNARPNTGSVSHRTKEDTVSDIAKIMLDKNYVSVLTSTISDVDVNHPHAKNVLSTLLRPLEQLTKLAIKIERASEQTKEDEKKNQQPFVPSNVDGEGDEPLPDLYRNSSLGMIAGSVMEEEDEDDWGTSEEGEDSFDEDEFDEDSGSDLSDMSEGEEEDEDLDEAMDSMDFHQHAYDSDMDEDEVEDVDDDEGNSGHGSHLSNDEDGDEDVDEDEDGREMTWHLEDIEDDPVIVRAEVTIDSGDELDGHHHRYIPDNLGEEDDMATLDQSDFDDDEDSDNLDEPEGELRDDMLLDAADLDLPFNAHDLPDGVLMEDDEIISRHPRSVVPLRRHERGLPMSRRNLLDGGSRSFVTPMDGNANLQDDVITHPLLANNQPASTSEGRLGTRPSTVGFPSRQRAPLTGNWQAFEDILGNSAVRMLENILNQTPQGAHTGPVRVDVQAGPGGMTRSFEFDNLPPPNPAFGNTGRRTHTEGATQEKEVLSALHDFQPMSIAERWHQEARMMYGNSVSEKALKLVEPLLNALIPIAIEDEKKLRAEEEKRRQKQREKEEEERKIAEEEKARKEEEEKKARQEEEEEKKRVAAETEAAATSAAATSAATTSATAQQSTATSTATSSQDKTTTNTPESATQETEDAGQSSQTERTTITINGESVDISGTGIDIEFLEALPDDLRAEVVSQHIQNRQPATAAPEPESISPEFLDALPPEIRDEVLRQESIERQRRSRQQHQETTTAEAASESAISGVSEDVEIATSPILRSDPTQDILNTLGLRTPHLDDQANSDQSRLGLFQQHLARRAGRFTEIDGARSPFGSPSKKPTVHRDAVQLVDRAQLATLARLLFLPQTISKALLNRLLLNLCENSKSRSDLLSLLVCVLHDGSNDLSAVDRSFAQLSVQKNTTKPAAKPKTIVPLPIESETVPDLITQRCLEVLMHVVSYNDQSLTYFLTENDCLAGLKRINSKKGKGKEKASTAAPVSSKYPLLVLMSLLDRPVFIKNTNLMEQLMHLLGTMCRPFPVLVKKYVEKVENKQLQNQKSQTSGNDTTEENERAIPKPPTIPDNYLKLVVHVLTNGDCSGKTFQYTLGAISHLSKLDGALRTITNELIYDAKQSGKQVLKDLAELLDILEHAMPGTEIQGSTLSHFSATSADQAKLLRVLKTIDYMYSPKSPTQATDTKNQKQTESEEALKNEKRVLQIYEELDFLPLWKMLGRCLSVIHEKEDLISVATVLLPLIESFLVVSKHAAEKGQAQQTNSLGPTITAVNPEPESPDDFFFSFTEDHKKILNIMVRNNPSLMSGSFSLLVRNPKMLEFDNKRNYFSQRLHKRTAPREHYPALQLNVRRQYVFEDSYHQLQGRTGEEIKHGKLNVRFYDEEGVDAGGVTREWFSVLARQMFDPNYALFITSAADKLTYQPNRASWVNPDHLSFFKFVGRLIGKAIYDGRLLDAYFTRSFYKHILGRQVDYRDVEAIDPSYYKSLVWMLENNITDVVDLTFSIDTDDFGTAKTIDLKPNGRDIPVTEQNKHEYVYLVTEQKLTTAIKDQINAFLQGFHDIIPASLIQIFNEQELELLISGLPDIDIDDWRNNTDYETYNVSSIQIQWFWRAVRSFDQEERAKLLQFATGTSKVPLKGFAHLQGSSGLQKFQIHKDFGGENRLPSAHTCFNQIDLPMYTSYESLRANLFKAINECSTGFGFV
ncbi:hypothetical protein CLU79DRAFT_859109 [Phycomyces nitens]|nr:hypothetical protein CLU79DRAFT_859109 [Phycomyces nitens]